MLSTDGPGKPYEKPGGCGPFGLPAKLFDDLFLASHTSIKRLEFVRLSLH